MRQRSILRALLLSVVGATKHYLSHSTFSGYQYRAFDSPQDRQLLDSASTVSTDPPAPLEGDPECPCMSREEVFASSANALAGVPADYGVGCKFHDIDTEPCNNACNSSEPLVDCLGAWCYQAWCWVSFSHVHSIRLATEF